MCRKTQENLLKVMFFCVHMSSSLHLNFILTRPFFFSFILKPWVSFDIQCHPFIIIVFVLCIFPYESLFQIKPVASHRHGTIVPPQTQPANLLPVVSSLIGVPVFA